MTGFVVQGHKNTMHLIASMLFTNTSVLFVTTVHKLREDKRENTN